MSGDWRAVLLPRMQHAGRIAVLGVGSELRGDDAAGMLLINKLQNKTLSPDRVLLMGGSTAPENFTGLICDYKPDLLLVVDAAHLGGQPGDMAVLSESQLDAFGFSTHMLPLSLMLTYLRQRGLTDIFLLGVQPKNTAFGFEPCPEVISAMDVLADCLAEALS